MKRKFLYLFLSVILTVSFTSCSLIRGYFNEDTPDDSDDSEKIPQEHTHSYVIENTDAQYIATEATCSGSATYFYSCECGASGTHVFVSGAPLPHSWIDATCQSPKTCEVCGATVGDVGDHDYKNLFCTVCGEAMDTNNDGVELPVIPLD